MYKIKHFLFGWDYIQWSNSCDHGIARIFKTNDGTVVYWRYKITNVLDIVHNSNQVNWLTCHPNKYFN